MPNHDDDETGEVRARRRGDDEEAFEGPRAREEAEALKLPVTLSSFLAQLKHWPMMKMTMERLPVVKSVLFESRASGCRVRVVEKGFESEAKIHTHSFSKNESNTESCLPQLVRLLIIPEKRDND